MEASPAPDFSFKGLSTPDLNAMAPSYDAKTGEPASLIEEARKRGIDLGKEVSDAKLQPDFPARQP